MRISDLDLLILPGLGGSGPDHWQNRWAQKLSTGRIVDQDDWERPDRDRWLANILREIDSAERPVALIGHSLGALSAASAIAETASPKKIAAAFLVAPPDLNSAAFSDGAIDRAFQEKAPQKALGVPGVLVASRNDAFSGYDYAERLANLWGLDLADAGEAGHINAESGHGPWPEGLMRLAGLFSKL